jgi:hypothetical protein
MKSYVMNVPLVYKLSIPSFNNVCLKIPSILTSLEEIYRYDPTEIYISSQGPIGLFGQLIAKLLNVHTVGYFHTDYLPRVREIAENEAILSLCDSYTRWFYSGMDRSGSPASST